MNNDGGKLCNQQIINVKRTEKLLIHFYREVIRIEMLIRRLLEHWSSR